MNRSSSDECQNAVKVVRAFFGYIWLITFFGCVILLVQASLEEKRIRYEMGKKNREKLDLLDEHRRYDIQIKELESYSRISALVETQLPQLGPPQKPAIEIKVPGLRSQTGFPDSGRPAVQDPGFLRRMRDRWRQFEASAWQKLRDLIE